MSEYKYKISIVSAVYNVEPFIREAIESIINQTIGIENIQLILVDDGSPDNSGAICDEYAAKYPNNIFVIHKENGGVSSARNAGLDIVEGKYVNFIDSDDLWEKNTLEKVWKFFEKHESETNIVSLPLKYFDGARGYHMHHYKFAAGNRIVDLSEDWDNPQVHIATSFIKADIFKEKNFRFDTALAYSEDSKLIQQILLRNPKIGFYKDCCYLYRKRLVGTPSALQSSRTKPNWYLPVMEKYFMELINEAEEMYGTVPKFLQMTLMYDLQWRIKMPGVADNTELTDEEKEKYLQYIRKVLLIIEDDVILAQRNIWGEQKFYSFKLKYAKKPEILITETNRVRCGFSEEASIPIRGRACVEFIELEDDILKITGNVNFYDLDYNDVSLHLLVNDEKVDVLEYFDNGVTTALGDTIVFKKGFYAEVSVKECKNYAVKIGAVINGVELSYSKLDFGRYAPLSDKYRRSYYKKGNRIIAGGIGAVFVTKSNFLKRAYTEFKLLCQIAKSDGKLGIGAAGLRILMRLRKSLRKKPLWLISDRASVAGDNGEALFRYLRENHKEIDARFVITKDSPDFERLMEVGPVLERDSNKHKMLSLISEYIISSHAENEIFCPLRSRVEPFRSMWCKNRFVFLQHGITQNNISGWIKKNNKNFYGVIAAAKPEYDSFFEYDYRYKKENIWLTGFARFDRLVDRKEKHITIMPTWRRYLTAGMDPITYVWDLLPSFKESDFYKFYNGLINSEKLIKKAKELGYIIDFFPHPTLQPHIEIFDKNPDVNFLAAETAYRDVYSRSALLLTDYSSAAFDFSYLRKPIIYTHFDKEAFYAGDHVCTAGYFEYERDGFGDILYDLDSTINCIIEYMENDCKLKDKYKERIDNFFAFNDKNNCKRIYEKLISK